MFPLGDTPAVNAYQLAADDRPSTRSGGARSRPASYVGRCNGLLPAGHHAGALHGSRTISNVAGVTEGAAGGGLFSPPSGSRNGDLASLAGAGACAGPGGGYGPVVRAATFGRSGTDLGLLAPAGPHPGRGRGGGMLYTLGSLGLPGEEDCATFEPLGLEAAEPPMAEPLSPVRTSSGGGGGAGTYAGGGHTAAVAAAHEASSTAGAAAAAAKSAAGPYAGGGSGSGGSGGSGPQSIRKMVSFTASLGPGRGEGLSRHEPIAGNSGASSSLFPTAPPGAADSGLPSGADLSVVVFDVAGLASETAAEVAEAASRAASLLDPTKPAVRRLLPPLWHASQAVCEPPARTVSGGLVLSACNSGGAVAAVGSAGSSQANRRAASLNTPGPGGGASKAAAEMRALLGFAATSPNSTSYDDVDVAGAALSLGMALQPPLVAAGSAFSSDLAAAAAAMAALQTSPGAGAGAAAARAPSGPASALGACMPSSSSSRRWLPPMDGTRFASATGLLTTADLGDAALEPSAGVSSCLLGRLAALSGPGAAGEADGASGSSHGGAGPGGSEAGCALMYRATTEGRQCVQGAAGEAAARGRSCSGSGSGSSSGSGSVAGSSTPGGSRSAATSGGVPAGAVSSSGDWSPAPESGPGGGLLPRRAETGTGGLVPSGSGASGGSTMSQLRLLGGNVGAVVGVRVQSGAASFVAAAGMSSSGGGEASGGSAHVVQSMRGRSFVMSARQRALLCMGPDSAAAAAAAAAAGGSAMAAATIAGSAAAAEDDEDVQSHSAQHQRLTKTQAQLPDALFRSNSVLVVPTPGAPSAERARSLPRPPSSGVPGGSLLSPAGAARQPSWCAPGASPRPAGPGLPLPPIQDLRVRAAAERL